MQHFEIGSTLLANRGVPLGDLTIPHMPDSALSSRDGLPVMTGLPRLVQAKLLTDEMARDEFLSGQVSAIELSERMTRAYTKHLLAAVEESGLSDLIRSEGYALVSFGGFARGNVGRHSDWDMILINDSGNPDRYHQALTEFASLPKHAIEAHVLMRDSAMLPSLIMDNPERGIVSLTALLKMNLLLGNESTLSVYARNCDSLLGENYAEVVQHLGRSIEQREQKSGTLFRLAEFDLKDSLGGLRCRDCIRWLDELAQRAHGRSLLSPADREMLRNADEVLLTAKHALHFSVEKTRGNQYTFFGNGCRERVLEAFGRSSPEFLPPRVVYEFLYATARQVHNLLNRVMLQSYELANISSLSFDRSPVSPKGNLVWPRSQTELGVAFKESKDIAPMIRGLFETGQLSKLIPDFGHAQFFVDRAGFHRYPLGEHQVRAVEELSRILADVIEKRFSISDVQVPADTAPLYLALLLHDVCKPDEGAQRNHHITGGAVARRVARELGFSNPQVEKAGQLVEDHMLIANISGHSEQSLSAEEMADRIPSLEYLQELLLLTLADKRQSNPSSWRVSREERIIGTYETMKLEMVASESHAEIYNLRIQRALSDRGISFSGEDVRSIISDINPRILSSYSVEVLAEKVRILLELKSDPEESVREDLFRAKLIQPERVDAPFSLYLVCRDSLGLLGRVSAYLDQRSMILRSALVDTHDGIVCDYLMIDPRAGRITFVGDDEARFVNGLRKAVFGGIPPSKYSGSLKKSQFENARFGDVAEVSVREDTKNHCYTLVIQDAVRRDVLPIIAPLLEERRLDIINAQIGCGNREIRHRLDLRSVDAVTPNLSELKDSIINALRLD